MKLSVLCAGRCRLVGGSGPGLNFVFTLETGTGTTEVLDEDVCNVLGARFQKPNPALIIIYQTTENMQP